MTDIVERLRGNSWATVEGDENSVDGAEYWPSAWPFEAADEIERLRGELASGSFYKEDDIDAMQDEIERLRAEVERLRAALERIQTLYQVTHCHAAARAALAEKDKG